MGPLLVLFDVDGTLLIDDAYCHGRAMILAMRSVYGVDIPDDAVQQTHPWGKTDLRIARLSLRSAGLTDKRIDRSLREWTAVATEAFVSEAAASHDAWKLRSDLLSAIAQLRDGGLRLTLLTGNLRGIAAAKVERMGVEPHLDLAIGAYGEDAEDREDLVPIARRRAGTDSPWPRQWTAVVGDTPGDIAAARADAVASIVFPSRRYPAHALHGASAVVSTGEELLKVLRGWEPNRP